MVLEEGERREIDLRKFRIQTRRAGRKKRDERKRGKREKKSVGESES